VRSNRLTGRGYKEMPKRFGTVAQVCLHFSPLSIPELCGYRSQRRRLHNLGATVKTIYVGIAQPWCKQSGVTARIFHGPSVQASVKNVAMAGRRQRASARRIGELWKILCCLATAFYCRMVHLVCLPACQRVKWPVVTTISTCRNKLFAN
jgi:hypothetical protein